MYIPEWIISILAVVGILRFYQKQYKYYDKERNLAKPYGPATFDTIWLVVILLVVAAVFKLF